MNAKLAVAIVLAVMTSTAAQKRGTSADRERAVRTFARSYFPGQT